MGYSTDFEGVLKFTTEPTARELAALNAIIDSHDRIDLKITKDFSGLTWNGTEKTREMVESVNFIVATMRKSWPLFGLTGELKAQGEEFTDRWTLVMKDGIATKVEFVTNATAFKCPHCSDTIEIETRRFECTEAGRSAYWEITVVGSTTITRFGKIGTKYQINMEEHSEPEDAQRASAKTIALKLAKGYKEI